MVEQLLNFAGGKGLEFAFCFGINVFIHYISQHQICNNVTMLALMAVVMLDAGD